MCSSLAAGELHGFALKAGGHRGLLLGSPLPWKGDALSVGRVKGMEGHSVVAMFLESETGVAAMCAAAFQPLYSSTSTQGRRAGRPFSLAAAESRSSGRVPAAGKCLPTHQSADFCVPSIFRNKGSTEIPASSSLGGLSRTQCFSSLPPSFWEGGKAEDWDTECP